MIPCRRLHLWIAVFRSLLGRDIQMVLHILHIVA